MATSTAGAVAHIWFLNRSIAHRPDDMTAARPARVLVPLKNYGRGSKPGLDGFLSYGQIDDREET